MRSILLVTLSLLALITAFLAYARFQATHVSAPSIVTPSTQPPPPPKVTSGTGIGEGVGAWFDVYDEKTGQLIRRLRAARYTPQEDGVVLVTHPVAEFFMPNHQMMRLTGETGTVIMPEPQTSSKKTQNAPSPGAPSRGQIHTVTIEIFHLFPDSDNDIADEIITTDNVQFDNETMLITTESYKDGTRVVPPDRVPVKMRGKKYDFDGQGLRLRWDEKDGRLDLLEIAHGEQLVVKDSSLGSSPFGNTSDKTTDTPSTMPSVSGHLSEALPAMLATTDRSAVGDALHSADPSVGHHRSAGQPPAKAPAAPISYVAIFYNEVHITQGVEVDAVANRMTVDFSTRKETPAPVGVAVARASEKPQTQPGQSLVNPVPDDLSPTGPASHPSIDKKLPTTKPASPPVVIRWTGKLVMLPAKADRAKVAPGDAVVELTGTPVIVRRTPANQLQGDDIRAASLIYHTAGGTVNLANSPAVPQVVISKLVNGQIDPNTTVTTSTLTYGTDAAGKKIATLTGPGHAAVPTESKSNEQDDAEAKPREEAMDARWSRGALVYFAGKGQDELAVEHVDLTGDVDVKHPQLLMQSQTLSLFFEPSAKPTTHPAGEPKNPAATTREASQSELKRVLAQEAVHCELAGQNEKKQTIDCHRLEMHTARSIEGKFYARQVNADGAVHAFDVDQDLRAGSIELTLKPATPVEKKPAVKGTEPPHEESDTAAAELEKMIARNNVQLINKEGSKASGSELTITTEDDASHVRLVGSPLATVIDAKQNTISGPLITVEPRQGIAHVVGAGNMHVLQEQADHSKPRPMDIAWTSQADMDGPRDRIDVNGDVIVKTIDADGAMNTATGDRVHIDLVKKPGTRPAIASTSPATKAAHNDAMASTMQMDVMKDKDVQTVTIEENAKVISTQLAANGSLLRQMELIAPKIIYQMADTKELAAKSLLIPSAGQMLMRDHRPPAQQQQGEKTPKPDSDESGSRGDTAFEWSKQLLYSEKSHSATMTGEVLIVHTSAGKDAADGPVRINADEVIALFEPLAHGVKATLPPTTHPAGQSTNMQLKSLMAQGHTMVARTDKTLTADHIEYDPITHWLFAHGTENQFAHFDDPDPRRSMTARDLQWNTQTWNVKASNIRNVNPK